MNFLFSKWYLFSVRLFINIFLISVFILTFREQNHPSFISMYYKDPSAQGNEILLILPMVYISLLSREPNVATLSASQRNFLIYKTISHSLLTWYSMLLVVLPVHGILIFVSGIFRNIFVQLWHFKMAFQVLLNKVYRVC